MARYTGPVCRLCRREGEKLFLKGDRCHTPKCAIERRGDRGGPGSGSFNRRRPTEYAIQLREKQKARRIYGVLERQFRRHYKDAGKQGGPRGERLLQQLELRADNVVYRLGIGLSRAHARQLVMHGHIQLNGRKHNIPSAVLSVGDTIRLREKSRDIDSIKTAIERAEALGRPEWMNAGADGFECTILAVPARDQIEAVLNEQLIVEFYSR